METVVWSKGEFELIENTLDPKPIYYFEHIYTGLITKTFKSQAAAIREKDEGRLKFQQRNRGEL